MGFKNLWDTSFFLCLVLALRSEIPKSHSHKKYYQILTKNKARNRWYPTCLFWTSVCFQNIVFIKFCVTSKLAHSIVTFPSLQFSSLLVESFKSKQYISFYFLNDLLVVELWKVLLCISLPSCFLCLVTLPLSFYSLPANIMLY